MICLRTKEYFRSAGRTPTSACRHLCSTYAAQTTPTNCDTLSSVSCTHYHHFFLLLQNLCCSYHHIILYLCAQAHISLSPTLNYSLVFLHFVLGLTSESFTFNSLQEQEILCYYGNYFDVSYLQNP